MVLAIEQSIVISMPLVAMTFALFARYLVARLTSGLFYERNTGWTKRPRGAGSQIRHGGGASGNW